MNRNIISKSELEELHRKYDDQMAEMVNSLKKEPELKQAKSFRGSDPATQSSVSAETSILDETRIRELLKKLPQKPIQNHDEYTDRLLKYIPTEVIALYLTLDAILRSSSESESLPNLIYWLIFIFCGLGTFLYLKRKEKITKTVQILISVGAFVVWIFAIGGPFKNLDWYKDLYGALLLPAYTFLIPLIKPNK